MMDWWLKTPDPIRAAVAAALCIALFFSDLVTAVEMNESQLYPVALLAIYRIRSQWLLWAVVALAVVLCGLGYGIDPPPDFWRGMTNRVFSAIVVLATALGMSKLVEHEQRLLLEATTDPLTGLLNRGRFVELCEREENRCRRHGLTFSVLMLDIDHFKRVNDTYGHPIGDLAIKALADICGSALRPHDLLARYGGEEFVLTLPRTDHDGAHIVAERIRQKVEAIELPTAQGAVRFTVSIGVASYLQGKEFLQVVGRADEALYLAKQGGRNRVVGLPLENGLAPA
jgi:diguanylate cyclase (GGDEF)-like protein